MNHLSPEKKTVTSREKLKFLISKDISPIRHSLETPWEEASERTKRLYTRKVRQVVNACLDDIVTGETETVLSSLVKLELKGSAIDSSLMECLAECYNNADHLSSRGQILSIMTDKLNFKDFQRWIPNFSKYQINISRHHLLLHGKGVKVKYVKGLNVITFGPKCNKALNVITLGPKCNKPPMQSFNCANIEMLK